MGPHKYQQVCVGAFILNHRNEALFVKRSDDDSFLPGYWELPGGGTDYGEEIEEALKREVKEECGIDVSVSMPLSVRSYYIKNKSEEIQRVEIVFLCKLVNLNQAVVLSNEHKEFRWLDLLRISELKLSRYMSEIISDIKAGLKI